MPAKKAPRKPKPTDAERHKRFADMAKGVGAAVVILGTVGVDA